MIRNARDKGASQVAFANTTGYAMERVGRLFLRLGFSHDGCVISMIGNAIPE